VRLLGYKDKRVNRALKCFLQQGDKTVILLVAEGYNFSVRTNWDSPFGQDTAGEKVGKAAQVGQSITGQTSISKLNSALTWTGNSPLEISFTGRLISESKASLYEEVQEAYAAILAMQSPNAKEIAGFGRRPQPVRMAILNDLIFKEVIIQDAPVKAGEQIHSATGLPMIAEVELTVTTETMLNSYEFATLFKR